jgi:hypothetical protein
MYLGSRQAYVSKECRIRSRDRLRYSSDKVGRWWTCVAATWSKKNGDQSHRSPQNKLCSRTFFLSYFVLCNTFEVTHFVLTHFVLTHFVLTHFVLKHCVCSNTFCRNECGGLDRHGFIKLNKICDDCFALFKEPEIYTLCRCSAKISMVPYKYFYGALQIFL